MAKRKSRAGGRKPAKRTVMGRPSEYPGKDPRPLSLSVRTATKETLRAAAERSGKSVSDCVDELAERFGAQL